MTAWLRPKDTAFYPRPAAKAIQSQASSTGSMMMADTPVMFRMAS
jgi:hypothetical protein